LPELVQIWNCRKKRRSRFGIAGISPDLELPEKEKTNQIRNVWSIFVFPLRFGIAGISPDLELPEKEKVQIWKSPDLELPGKEKTNRLVGEEGEENFPSTLLVEKSKKIWN
jgi:hypothetical protein